jgi:hypothetical protein
VYSSYVDRDLENFREEIANLEGGQEVLKEIFQQIDLDKDSFISEEEVE